MVRLFRARPNDHEFVDYRRTVTARLNPNELMSEFNFQAGEWLWGSRALKYFAQRDPHALEPLKKKYALPPSLARMEFALKRETDSWK